MKPISGLNAQAPAPAPPASKPAEPTAPQDSVEVGGDRSFGHSLARGVFGVAGGVGGAFVGFSAGAIKHAGDNSIQAPDLVTRSARWAFASLGLVQGLVAGAAFGPAGIAAGLVLGPILGAAVGGAVTGAVEGGIDAVKGGLKGGWSGIQRGSAGGAALADRFFGPGEKPPEGGTPPAPPQPAPPAPEKA